MKPTFTAIILALLAVGAWLLVSTSEPSSTKAPQPERNTSLSAGASAKEENSATKSRTIPFLIRELSDPSRHLSEQIAALHELPAELTPEELAALVDLLRQPAPQNIDHRRWHALLNEVMVILRDPKHRFTDYAVTMGGLIADRNLDPTIRDYAAQHLAQSLINPQQTISPDHLNQAVQTLLSAITGEREADQMVSGTSLMALCHLYEQDQAAQPEAAGEGEQNHNGSAILAQHQPQLHQAIAQLAQGQRPSAQPLRISAIQAAGRLRVAECQAQIRHLAQADSPEPMLRISAIAALGNYRDPQDKTLLTEIATGPTKHRFAAQAALEKLSR